MEKFPEPGFKPETENNDNEKLKDFYVKETEKGKAVFANRDFLKSEKIMDFKGQTFTFDELPDPFTEEDDHYVQIGKNLYMGPSGDVDDLVNHSCDPNTGLVVEGNGATLVAIKDIKKGDELTWDYSTTMDEDDWEMKCLCGSPNCRGIMKDFKYLPKEIQAKYIALGVVPKYIIENLNK